MAEAKKKLPTIVSPTGIAAFAWLSKPDTGKKYSDDKYKVTLVLTKGDGEVEQFVAMINDAHEKARGKKKTESPVKDGDDKTDQNGNQKEEFKGKWLLTFKSKFEPQLLQKGTKDELAAANAPRSGDVVKVAFAMLPYEEGKNAGISLQMRAVKLMERRARADYSGADWGDDGDEGGEEAAPKGGKGGNDNEDF
jgi:hypothetical protein